MLNMCTTGGNGIWGRQQFGKEILLHLALLLIIFRKELMKDGDSEGLLEGLKTAATALDR